MRKTKVFVLVYRNNSGQNEYLALQNNPADPDYGGDFWYVITGNVEEGESLENAARREIDEETGITSIRRLIRTDTLFKYSYRDVQVEEFTFVAKVDEDVRHLNEENIAYKWLTEEDFLKTIRWEEDKKDLLELISLTVS